MIINGMTAATIRAGIFDLLTYTGKYRYSELENGNWEIRLLSDGVLTINNDCTVDIFAVGGGGGGGVADNFSGNRHAGGGGGGGYTTTVSNYSLLRGAVLTAVIGAGGTSPTDASESNANSFVATNGGTTKLYTGTVEGSGTTIITAYGGNGAVLAGSRGIGGAGGSGGASEIEIPGNGAGAGGTNGGNGSGTYGGMGQGTTTRAFGEESGELFAGGGGAGAQRTTGIGGAGGAGGGADGSTKGGNYFVISGKDGRHNTGGGGGGGGIVTFSETVNVCAAGGAGGSGIIILRNHRRAS